MCCDMRALEIIICKIKLENGCFNLLLSIENIGCVAVNIKGLLVSCFSWDHGSFCKDLLTPSLQHIGTNGWFSSLFSLSSHRVGVSSW